MVQLIGLTHQVSLCSRCGIDKHIMNLHQQTVADFDLPPFLATNVKAVDVHISLSKLSEKDQGELCVVKAGDIRISMIR